MLRRTLTIALGLMVLPANAMAADYVNDPLVDAAFPGRGSQGGSYGPNGWTTSGTTDAVWYEIADALPTAAVEFSVTGVSVADSLTGADHDIFAVYQAPTGQPEPVEYSPYFRNNDFKVFTRIFGVQEPNRAGAMKLEFIVCPRGDPWYHDAPCDPGCGSNGLAYANGMDTDIGWDAATWYRIRVEWGNGAASFSRDGAVLGTVPYVGTYAPQPLRVRIGSPRHGISDVAYMPSGLTFKDVLVAGEPGVMTPVCGTPDGGTMRDAGPEMDAGGPVEVGVLADVTAASWSPSLVFEDVADLNVEGSDTGDPLGVVYLRFPPPTGTVKKALLRLRAHAYPSAAGGAGEVHAVADTTWSEDTLTWDNRPPFDQTGIAGPAAATPDTDLEWDVTSLVAAGTTSFALVSEVSDGAHYVSKEAGGTATGPKLILDLDAAPSGAGGGSSSSAATAGPGGSTSGAHGVSEETSSGDGCGCRIGAAGPVAAQAAAAALMALLVRRRRRAACKARRARTGENPIPVQDLPPTRVR